MLVENTHEFPAASVGTEFIAVNAGGSGDIFKILDAKERSEMSGEQEG